MTAVLLQVDVADGVAARAPLPRGAAGRAPLGHHPGVGDGVPQAGRQPQDEASLCEYPAAGLAPSLSSCRRIEMLNSFTRMGVAAVSRLAYCSGIRSRVNPPPLFIMYSCSRSALFALKDDRKKGGSTGGSTGGSRAA